MISRRSISAGLVTTPLLLRPQMVLAQAGESDEDRFDQLIYPPIEAIDDPQPFGYDEPTQKQKDKAKAIEQSMPKGPTPVAIAQAFVDRYYQSDPEAISQWPAPSAWNPLVRTFFGATTLKANNDMVAWCAAFANWCIERSGRDGSRSAASQSFLSQDFKKTNDPQPGDLAIFTCYDRSTGKSLGLGHVTFFKRKTSDKKILVVGGNQAKDNHSSIISERDYGVTDRDVRRHIGNEYVLCTMRLNTYVSMA
jgi:uncharacterized protein (TIGR02594 family)